MPQTCPGEGKTRRRAREGTLSQQSHKTREGVDHGAADCIAGKLGAPGDTPVRPLLPLGVVSRRPTSWGED